MSKDRNGKGKTVGKNMKRILYSVCIGSLALALTAGAAQERKSGGARPQQRTANVHAARPANSGAMRSARSYNSTAQHRQRSYAQPRTSSASNRATRSASAKSATVHQRNAARSEALRERNVARNQQSRARTNVAKNTRTNRPTSTTSATARNRNVTANRERNVAANRNTNVNRSRNANEFRGRNNVAINRNRNFAVNRTQNAAFYRGGNARVTNNWRGDAFRGQRYAAFRNYNRQWHDRSWWRSHYNRIVFVNNGWWYWNAGYWFPAWGYAPGVSFVFDGPIYGYNGLSPDQVTVNVQQQLASAGYYDGPIDGVLGPTTREAIAAYQADNGLPVTSAIDEPTLATMGLA